MVYRKIYLAVRDNNIVIDGAVDPETGTNKVDLKMLYKRSDLTKNFSGDVADKENHRNLLYAAKEAYKNLHTLVMDYGIPCTKIIGFYFSDQKGATKLDISKICADSLPDVMTNMSQLTIKDWDGVGQLILTPNDGSNILTTDNAQFTTSISSTPLPYSFHEKGRYICKFTRGAKLNIIVMNNTGIHNRLSFTRLSCDDIEKNNVNFTSGSVATDFTDKYVLLDTYFSIRHLVLLPVFNTAWLSDKDSTYATHMKFKEGFTPEEFCEMWNSIRYRKEQ